MSNKKTLRTNKGLVMLSCNTAWNVLSRIRLLEAIIAEGWDLITLAADDENAHKIRKDLSIPFIPLPMKSDSTSIFQDVLLFFKYLQLYKKYKPHVVLHINNKPNIYGTLAANLLRIPSISNITGLGIVAEKSGVMKKLVYLLYRTAFYPKTVRVFFQNKEDQKFFVQNRLVDQKKTQVIPGSGVNTEQFTPKTKRTKNKSTMFLFNGRLLISKGVCDFIGAARRVKSLYSNTFFTIIGENDLNNPVFIPKKDLDQAISEGIITYAGRVDNVQPYLANADCVVLPSRYREGVPRALLEAAAMGKPLIVADSVGTREPVIDGTNGYIVPPADPEALAKAMIKFITLPTKEKSRMGQESRKIAVERFADSIVIQSYIAALADT